MRIYFKNKIVSIGDGSKVYTEDKEPVLKIKGKIFTMTNKKKIYGLDGKLLYKVRKKFWHFLKRSAYITDAHGKILMQLKEKHSILGKGFDVLRSDEEYNIEWGGFAKGISKVYHDGELICTIKRQILALVDTFVLDIEKEDDLALCVAMTTAIDIIYDGD